MANITVSPQGNIYLCKTKLESDYKNQLTFTNATAQSTYFSGTVQKTYSNYTYVKKDNYVQVSDNIDTIIGCNYMYYRNVGFTTKIYYCFITRMEYINENCTRIYFETDVFQTWQFQIEYKQSFVEREHVNDDTIGLHTVPEQLETGDYTQQNIGPFGGADLWVNYMSDFQFVVAISEWPFDQTLASVKYYNGIYSGLKYLAFNNATYLGNFLIDIQDESTGDPIYSIFVVPQFITGLDSTDFDYIVSGHTSWKAAWVPEALHSKSISDDIRIADAHILDQDYSPRNNKLLVYPYRYILINNNAGSSADYRYEWFYDKGLVNTYETCKFKISGTIGTGCNIKIYPTGYGKYNIGATNKNLLYSLDGGKLPTCCWLNDPYVNWLTQNAVNMPLQALGNVGKIASGLTGNITGAVSGITGIASQLGEIYTHSLEPNTAKGGVNQGDINCSDNIGFSWYRMSIKKEYAEIIDKYFDMFGYKINLVKVPNITGRTNWNYVKTIQCNFDGDIPQTDLQIIKRIFDNGITLWHNPSTMLNYSNTNSIVT